MRRLLRALSALFIAAAGFAGVANPAAAADAPPTYVLGVDYREVGIPGPPPNAQKVEVQEIFSYGCPHCNEFDPKLQAWEQRKPAWVEFERIPNGLGRPEWDTLSRAFYIAQVLGVGDQIRKPLFAAIHEQKLPLYTLDSLRPFFAQVAGVKPADFDDAAHSFVVDNKLRRADEIARSYNITGVPTLIVDGRYAVEVGKSGFDGMIKVLDFVTEQQRKARKL